jgi:hypothetical protein
MEKQGEREIPTQMHLSPFQSVRVPCSDHTDSAVLQMYTFKHTHYCLVAGRPASKLISFIVVVTMLTCSLYLFCSYKDV